MSGLEYKDWKPSRATRTRNVSLLPELDAKLLKLRQDKGFTTWSEIIRWCIEVAIEHEAEHDALRLQKAVQELVDVYRDIKKGGNDEKN